jgi:integrase
MRKPLTDAAIQRYRPTGKVREISDPGHTGLRLVIQPKGSMSFVLRFRRPGGGFGKLTLGPYDPSGREIDGEPVIGQPLTLAAAHVLAAIQNRDRAQQIDILDRHRKAKSQLKTEKIEREANVFGAALVEFYIKHRTKKEHGHRPRRWREDAAQLGLRYPVGADPKHDKPEVIRGSLADVWSDRPISEIDGDDIHGVVSAATGQNVAKGRKTYAALSVFFGWALKQRRITSNPCIGVFHPGAPESRERVLDDTELVRFWQACDRVSVPFGALFKLLLLTGCRLREVAGMRRDELVDGLWTILGNRTKNGRSLKLQLPKLALDIVNGVPHVSDQFVFSTTGTAVSGFGKAKQRLDAAMGPMPEWRLHDLRRSFASGLAALKVQLPVVERLLNHVSGSFGGVAGVYQRYEFEPEMAKALQLWANHVEGLITGKPDNVIDMSSKRQR